MEGNEKVDQIKKKNKKGRTNGFEEWGGYMAAKKRKLNAQFDRRKQEGINDEGHTSNIFSGVSIYVNGYTNPSAEELKKLMSVHGGKYHYYYSLTHTSHMIATNLPDSKIKSLKGRKVVSPEWIIDSIKARKLLPDNDYMLYTPEVTDGQQRLKLSKIPNFTPTNMSNIVQEMQLKSNASLNLPVSISKQEECFKNFTSNVLKQPVPSTLDVISNDRLPVKAGDPDFISEFYNRSRLHHIATSGQDLKAYAQHLASMQKGNPFLQREKLKQLYSGNVVSPKSLSNNKWIMHIDMDCFFVSVGLRDHPELKGKPVAVTHSKGKRGMPQAGSNIEYEANYYSNRFNQNVQEFNDMDEIDNSNHKNKYSAEYGSLSEVASCSYEARKAGIRNGMFLGEALRLCPDLKTIPYDFEGYTTVSKLLYDTVASYTLDIEAISCDELYIDCTELLQDVKIPIEQFVCILRSEIYQKTQCTASAGIGKNMLLARLATKLAKPNGQYILMDSEIDAFMKNQLVENIPGVGYSTSKRLEQLGIKTCEELQNISIFKLQQEFGPKTGQTLFEHCRGIDSKTVTLEKDRKSVSAEINYGIRFEQEQEIYNFINSLAMEVEQRLKKINRKGRSLTLKLMVRKEDAPMQTAKFMGHGVCNSICKSTILKAATDDSKIIGLECNSLARALKIKPQDYRGLGIQVAKLESSIKGSGMKTMQHFLEKNAIAVSSNSNESSSVHFTLKNTEVSTTSDVEEPISNSVKEPAPTNVEQPTLNTLIKEDIIRPNSGNLPNQNLQEAYYAQIEQIDQSVLDALPAELRQEILSARSRKQENISPQKVSPVKGKFSHISKRGRPTGTKTRKPPKVGSPQKTITDYQKIIPFKKVESSSIVTATKVVPRKKATIANVSDIDEVRDLLKEWVTTIEVPIEEDINYLKDYMIELIEEDLEKTDLILKHFYRLVNSASHCWKEAYLLLLSYVQQKMLQDVGYMLKAKDSFENT